MNTHTNHNALIVADHPKWISAIKHFIEEMAYHVSVAVDGKQVRALLASEKPSIVFIDMRLPHGSAYELCESIRRDPALSSTRIIILGEKAYPEDIAFVEESGADAFLGLPLAKDALNDIAGRFLVVPPASLEPHSPA